MNDLIINMEPLYALERIRHPILDTLLNTITFLGDQNMLIIVFCALYWCVNKRMAYVMGVVFFVSSLAVQGLKTVFRIPRPWVTDPTFAPVGSTLNPVTGLAEGGAIDAATGYAFPSGHTQNAAALLGGIGAQVKWKWLRGICFFFILLVGFTRMYLGVHYLADVLVSLIITLVVLLVALRIMPREEDEVCIKREAILSGVIAAVAIVVFVYAFMQAHNGNSTDDLVRDATRAGAAALAFAIGMFVERVWIRFSVKSKNLAWQIGKYALGMVGTLAIMEGLRIMGRGLAPDALRFFLTVVWITMVYPLVIKRFFQE